MLCWMAKEEDPEGRLLLRDADAAACDQGKEVSLLIYGQCTFNGQACDGCGGMKHPSQCQFGCLNADGKLIWVRG
jgi:hypothetical protein